MQGKAFFHLLKDSALLPTAIIFIQPFNLFILGNQPKFNIKTTMTLYHQQPNGSTVVFPICVCVCAHAYTDFCVACVSACVRSQLVCQDEQMTYLSLRRGKECFRH